MSFQEDNEIGTPFNPVMQISVGGGAFDSDDSESDLAQRHAEEYAEDLEEEDDLEIFDEDDDIDDIDDSINQGQTNEEDDDDLEDATTGYVFGKLMQKEGAIPEDLNLNKDISLSEVKELTLKAWQEELEKVEDKILAEKGFTQENLKYIQYLMDGGDPTKVQEFVRTRNLSELEIDGEDDSSLENRKTLIMEMYKAQGIPEKRAKNLYNSVLDNGEDFDEALEAATFFKTLEVKEIESQKVQKQEYEKRKQDDQAKIKQMVDSVIDKGTVGDVTLTPQEKRDVRAALYDETEYIDSVDAKGRPMKVKATKYTKLMQDFDADVEKQILFVYYLLNGFKSSNLVKKGKQERDSEILNNLDAVLTKKVVRRGERKDMNKSRVESDNSTGATFEYSPRKF